MNAANEEAVVLFLNRKIRFTDIFDIVENTVRSYRNLANPTLSEIEETNLSVREAVKSAI